MIIIIISWVLSGDPTGYPDISPSHLDVVKTEIAKASNVAAKAGENVGGWIDDFRRTEGS
ncbi:DNA-packaging protein [Escherichia coli]|nr:DNA-packaging protein [Escherichia coli]